MDFIFWLVATVLTVGLLVLFALSFSARYTAGAVQRLGRTVGLEVPAHLEPVIRARQRRGRRFGVTGAAIGIVIGAALVLVGVAPAGGIASTWLVLGSYFAGLAVGGAVHSVTDRTSVAPDAQRFARTGAVSVKDYLPTSELAGARIVVILSLGALGAAALFSALGIAVLDGGILLAGGLLVGLGVASLVVFELIARRIVDRGQPAASPAELAWDDALRATTLREIVTAPLCLGLWGAIFIIFGLAGALNVAWYVHLALAAVVAVAVVGVLVMVVVTAAAGGAQQHYLRRLWPQVAAAGREAATR